VDLQDDRVFPEAKDPRLHMPRRGVQRGAPDAHQLGDCLLKDIAMSILNLADTGGEGGAPRPRLGTKLL
jgi:hypothetical protein